MIRHTQTICRLTPINYYYCSMLDVRQGSKEAVELDPTFITQPCCTSAIFVKQETGMKKV